MLDGHSTHYTPDVVRTAAKQGVVMLCLPPHTSHCMQPLDVSFFKPLKAHWSAACHSYMVENPGRVVKFSSLFKEAWVKAIKPETFIAGFRKAGVHPVNCNAISVVTAKSSSSSASTSGDTIPSSSAPYLSLDDDLTDNSEDVEAQGTPSMFGDSSADSGTSPQYTRQQLEQFQRRYDYGYDVYTDHEYVEWLRTNHPDDLPEQYLETLMEDPLPFTPSETPVPELVRPVVASQSTFFMPEPVQPVVTSPFPCLNLYSRWLCHHNPSPHLNL